MIDGLGRMPPPMWQSSDASAPAPAPTPAGDDDVALSLPGLVAGMSASPPVDAARVQALQTAIADGSYQPEPARIAAAIMADWR